MTSRDPFPDLAELRFQRPDHSAFAAELRAEAQAYLRDRGDHRFADRRELAKGCALLIACAFTAYGTLHANGIGMFATCYVAFVLLVALLAVNFMHIASHGAVWGAVDGGHARTQKWNRVLMRIVTTPLGVEPEYWGIRHVDYHHAYPNIEYYDLDTEENALLRQTPFQRWYPHQRFQHLYWPLIAALSMPYIGWVHDWSDRLGKTVLARDRALAGWQGWLLFIGTKLAHFALMLGLPVWAAQRAGIGWGEALGVYWLAQLWASYFVVVLLLGTHWAGVEFFLPPPEGALAHTWYEHTMRTSVDWQPRPRWLGFWMGGLHRHLTHHLFPTWHPRHYDALGVIVARLACKHGLPYRELGHLEVFLAQFRFLKAMGRRPNSARETDK